MALKKRNQVCFDGVLDDTFLCFDGLEEPMPYDEALPSLEEQEEMFAVFQGDNNLFGGNHRQPLNNQFKYNMEENKVKYKVGKHPHSLANLKRGGWKSKEEQMRSSRKGVERKKAKRTMREVTNDILKEDEVYLIVDEQGNEVEVVLSKLEAIARKFIDDCIDFPTPKKIETLRKILGEDETTINIQEARAERYVNVEIPQEEKIRLAMYIMDKANEV